MKSSHNKTNPLDRYKDNLDTTGWGFRHVKHGGHYKESMPMGHIFPQTKGQVLFFLRNDIVLKVTNKVQQSIIDDWAAQFNEKITWSYSSSGRTAYYDDAFERAMRKFIDVLSK